MDRRLCISRVNSLFIFSHAQIYGGDLDDIIDYNDLTFVLKGKLTYIIEGEEVDVSENTAIFLPGKSHRVRVSRGSADVEYISFNFTVDSPLKFPRLIKNCITEDISDLLNITESIFMGHSYHREETLLMAFQILLFTLDDIISISEQNPHVEKILSYIDSHYTERVTLERIADAVHLAPSYCSNLIKKEMGITISEIITVKRMELARNLMLQKNKSMIEIAHCCGYNYYGYFLKCFKRVYGYNPSEMF